jgi:hypothetical protein
MYKPKDLKRWAPTRTYVGLALPDYYRAGIERAGNSDAQELSNFAHMLEALGGRGDTVRVLHRPPRRRGRTPFVPASPFVLMDPGCCPN